MNYEGKTAAEVADILIGMMPTQKRKDTSNQNDNPGLIARRKRLREKQYVLEDRHIENDELEVGEFDSNWSCYTGTRKNCQKGSRY